ncbi:prohibitin family protein [Ruegeria sp. 2205SS24-7]|uniref:prohibitin family protein n=1 Tax=Ruegeria discodermiae TaxID=3064389 RepID=UPI002740C334|nr:prohibitin family protein [Ruegeria sp. 2205SS24-7]MDP5218859.1 prohibitin family protein [Ruegeria sp. 2205SS24-7]
MTQKAGAASADDDEIEAASRWRRLGLRVRFWRRRHAFSIGLTLLIIVFLVALALPRAIVNVPAGHVGVLWKRFFGGTVTTEYMAEGIHLIFPWDRAYIYDARLRTIVHSYDTISSNGLSMQVEIATRYRINRSSVGTLHKEIGPNYPNVLLNPEIGSNAREVISRYTPEQLYTDARAFIQAQILERMVTQLGSSLISQSPSGQLVYVEDTLIRSVALPDSVVEAIERKTQQYHVMLEYDFRIEREELERQRKNIEATGIREFQEIVSGTITDEYLRLRGIDATLAISTSDNSKIIVMGGSDGLPVILNTGEFEGSGTRGRSETLEDITVPLNQNAALTETQSTNAIQPDPYRLQHSGAIATPDGVGESVSSGAVATTQPQLITSEPRDAGHESFAAEQEGLQQEPPMHADKPQEEPGSGQQTPAVVQSDGSAATGATPNPKP